MKTTSSFGVVALVAMAIAAVTFGSGCTNPSPSDEQACNGFCPTDDGNILPLTIDGDVGRKPCNNACIGSESFVCLDVDRDGDGDTEETCVLESCGDGVLDSGEDCDGGTSCLATCYCPDDLVPDLAMGCEAPCFPVCLADDRSPMICGSDGCGGSCGTCPAGTACNADQTECSCVPDCTADDGTLLVCGGNGCGGSCGTCEVGSICSADQTACEPAPPCTPDCTGLICGNDGCGGSCGSCLAGTACSADQTDCSCVPDCTADDGTLLVCGGNGCGGTCGGDCPVTFTCSADQTTCVPPPPEVCDNGDDEDLDGDVDVADSDCADETVAAMGLYFPSAGNQVYITTLVESLFSSGPLPDNFTYGIAINGADAYAQIRVLTTAVEALSGGQEFVVWPDCSGPGTAWPAGGGVVVDPGESFASTSSTATWYCFFLSGATE